MIEDYTIRGLQKHSEPLSCTSWLSVWVAPRNQSFAAKPLDQVLIRKIRFCKKNSGLQSKVIKFDPRSPNERTREKNGFKILSESLQNYLPVSSFFLFHDIKSNCVVESDSEETNQAPESVPFTDSYDIATGHSESMIDSYVSGLTITQQEMVEMEGTTRGRNKNNLRFEKRKSLLTASHFGKAAKKQSGTFK